MRKVIYLLALCMVLGVTGCGKTQENERTTSESVFTETKNEENSDVVQSGQIADTGAYPPCLNLSRVVASGTCCSWKSICIKERIA